MLRNNNTNKIALNNKGFTLIETLVALAIFSASIIGLISVTASGVSDINYSKNKISATYLAQEGIELVRNYRDTVILSGGDWQNFTSDAANIPGLIISSGRFLRVVTINPDSINNQNEVEVISEVRWNQGSVQKSIVYKENLLNWVSVE